jgi:hypothetical protein
MRKKFTVLKLMVLFLAVLPLAGNAQISAFPYLEDFENGPGGWVVGGTNSSWELGTPANTNITGAASGDSAWATNLTGNYNPSECSHVESPFFDFTNLSAPKVRMQIWWESEFSWDGAQLQASTDSGLTWQRIGNNGDPFNWYNDGTINGLSASACIGDGIGWTGRDGGGSNGWVSAEQAVPSLAGEGDVLFRIVFGSDGSVHDEGFAFDDFEVLQIPALDLGVSAVTGPPSGCLGTAESISVSITNFGTDTVSTFLVGYQVADPALGNQIPVVEPYTGAPIPPGGNASFTFAATYDFSGPGNYVVSGFTILTGDGDNNNDGSQATILNPVQSPTLANPYFEDFETFSGTNYQNGWANGNGTSTWSADSDGTGSSNTGPELDHTTGTNSGIYMYTEASTTAFSTFELLSPCINLSNLTCPKLSFWYHMYGATMGELHVDVSNDNGATWTLDVTPPLIGEQQTSDIAPWGNREANLGNFSNSTIIIRFRGIIGSSFTSDMAIDDVSVFEGTGEDVAIIGVTSPTGGCGGAAEPITIEVTNLGCSTIPSGAVGATYNSTGTLNSGGPYTETINQSIAPGQVISYTFTGTANVSMSGTYNFTTGVAFLPTSGITDADLLNNVLVDSFTNATVVAPWLEDFESWGAGTIDNYPNGWVDGGASRGWETEDGTTGSSSTGPNVDHTLGTSSGLYLYTEASSASDFSIITPCIDLGTLSCPQLKFWYHMYGAGITSLNVDVSTDAGATWNLDEAVLLGQQQTANADPWDSLLVNLSAYAGSTINIRFRGSNTSLTADIAIDDVEIINGAGADVAITAISSPVSGCGLSMEAVTVEVTNSGCGTLTNVPIGFQVGLTGTPTIESVPGPIPAGTSVSYTFNAMANLSTVGPNFVGVATGLPGDVNTANDTVTLTVVHDFQPNNPAVVNDTACFNAPATLSATSNGDTILWYDAPMGGLPIALGNSYTTPPLTSADTFYATGGSYAQNSLISSFADNNGASGNMFDVVATGGNVTVDSLYINTSRTTDVDIEIWYKVGSYQGNTADPSVWIQLGRDTVPANGSGVGTPVPIHLNVTIPQGQTYAFNVFSHSAGMNYITGSTEGAVFASDNFIEILEGIGTNSAFPTTFNVPRVWSGELFYTAIGCESDRVMAIADVSQSLVGLGLGPDTTICGNDQITLDPGNNAGFNLSYAWGTGDTTQTITFSGSGGPSTTIIPIGISDDQGCTLIDDITIVSRAPINVNPTVINVSCFGAGDGSVQLGVSGGNGPFSYSWSTGDTTQNVGDLNGGVYNIDVMDSVGCSAPTTIVQVNEPAAAVSAAVDAVVDAACNGDSTGSIAVTISGGTAPYTFNWSNGDTNEDPANLPAGSYSGVITDANGCVLTAGPITVAEPAAIGVALDALVDVADCFGDSTGSIDITVSGGTAPFSFSWSNGATTEDLANLPAGNYTGTITDANGCVLTSPTLTIAQPTELMIGVDGVRDEDCAGDNSGFIFITPSGGTPPYTYLWSNGSTDPDLNAIGAGDYSGTVTDANGCELTAGPVTIAALDSVPTADFSSVVSGGTVDFTNASSSNATSYVWDFGDGGLSTMANPSYVYTANGVYTVTLVATNSCGSDTTTQTVDMGSVSIDNILNTYIQVYPNPNNGEFFVEFSELSLEDVRIKMSSLDGKVVAYEELGQVNGVRTHKMSLPANLAKGVYILNVTSNKGTLSKRLMIE